MPAYEVQLRTLDDLLRVAISFAVRVSRCISQQSSVLQIVGHRKD